MYRITTLVLLLLTTACASIIGEPPEQSGAGYVANTPALIDDEEKLRKTLIALRKQDKIEQAKRIEHSRALAAVAAEKQRQKAKADAVRNCTQIAHGERLWQRVPFKSGHVAVEKGMAKSLTNTAGKYLARPCLRKLVVRGFCDGEPIGGYSGKHQSKHGFKSQVALSKARAEAVAGVLVAAGVDRAMIEVEGYGARNFIADNATVAGRNKNRRVDVFLVETSMK